MVARSAAVLLGALLLIPFAIAGQEALYPRADGTLAPTHGHGAIRDGTYRAPPAAEAYVLAPGAFVSVPSRLLLERGAQAELLLNGHVIGDGRASGQLLDLGAGRTIFIDNPETSVAKGSVLALGLSGVAPANGVRLVVHRLAAPSHPAVNVTPPTPAPTQTPTPTLTPTPPPTPATPTLTPTPTPTPSSGAQQDPSHVAPVQFGFPTAAIVGALPDTSTSLLLVLLATSALVGLALVRLGRD